MTARPVHLVARFFGTLVPRRVSAHERLALRDLLTAPELDLWLKMRRADQVESLDVAHRADRTIAADVHQRDEYLAAALLHDVGKLDADFGPYRRAIATIAGAVAGHEMVGAWKQTGGFTRRCALYLDHGALGAQRIRFVGGRELVAQWAAAHHDPSAWPTDEIPADVCRALARADGENV